MGTLFDQDPRDYRRATSEHIDAFLADAVELSKKHNVAVADVIAAAKALELRRRNSLFVDNGNIFDEQMSGFGSLLSNIDATLERIGDLLKK